MVPSQLNNRLPTPLKNDGVKVSWDDDIPNIRKNKKCLKPPTRIYVHHQSMAK